MDRKLIIPLLAFALFLYGCTLLQGKQCPASCDDNNSCTNDYCDASTNFECVHANLSGDQVGCSGSAGLCKTKTCSEGSCGTSSIKNCYASEEYDFSVMYPQGWLFMEGVMGTTVAFMGPREENFTTNCIIAEEALPSGYSITKYVNESKGVLRRIFNNYTLVSEANRTINGEPAYELVSTYTQGVYNNKIQQVIIVNKGNAHIIGCTTTTNFFDKYKSNFESIITSFKLE